MQAASEAVQRAPTTAAAERAADTAAQAPPAAEQAGLAAKQAFGSAKQAAGSTAQTSPLPPPPAAKQAASSAAQSVRERAGDAVQNAQSSSSQASADAARTLNESTASAPPSGAISGALDQGGLSPGDTAADSAQQALSQLTGKRGFAQVHCLRCTVKVCAKHHWGRFAATMATGCGVLAPCKRLEPPASVLLHRDTIRRLPAQRVYSLRQ